MILMGISMYRTWYLKTKYIRLFGHNFIYSLFVAGFFVWFPILKKQDTADSGKLRLKINIQLFIFYGLLVMLLVCLGFYIKGEKGL